jgi:hypothetical protein
MMNIVARITGPIIDRTTGVVTAGNCVRGQKDNYPAGKILAGPIKKKCAHRRNERCRSSAAFE